LPANTEFLPLGVYALAPAGQSDATAVVQLSVSKDGILRGSYCDLVSDQGQTIYGAVDQKSQRAAWKVGEQGQVIFETTLPSLTQSAGSALVYFANGDARQWILSRFENQQQQTGSQQ
jgi:hypothetical protein